MQCNKEKQMRRLQPLSPAAAGVLHLGLPVILTEFLFFLIFLRRDIAADPIYALHYYPTMLEHIMMSLTLLIAGAFLFDYIAKREKQ